MTQKSQSNAVIAFFQMRLAVFRQTDKQVFRRHAGDRTLVGPYPVSDEAIPDWQFALLSVAAYGRSNPKRRPMPAGTIIGALIHRIREPIIRLFRKTAVPTPNVDGQLNDAGWTRWADFPDPKLEQEMKISHLRAEVWQHKASSSVAVAFGGTVFTSGKDWRSNFRWFIPWHKDEYTEIVSRFGPDFVKALAIRLQQADAAYPQGVTLYSTGHSLGGGLAQQFAYSLPEKADSLPDKPEVRRVSEVFAFDPSPVTGYRSVDPVVRDRNKVGLKIARVYERGEVLAILRSFTSLVVKPTSKNAEIRGARFNLFYSVNPIAGHSIAELASKMQAAAGVPAWSPPVVHPPIPPPSAPSPAGTPPSCSP